jgi:spermidine dehydrogenase
MGFTPAGYADTGGSVRLHFPDGNATIARGLVRNLIPAAVPGATVQDLITARIDYSRLDRAGEPVRLRLNSTVVRVRHEGAPTAAKEVLVTYLRDNRAYRVRSRHCVLACYNMIIPYLSPELPETQKKALHELVKTPLVYTSVAIRSSRAFAKLGVNRIYAPGGYHTLTRLNAVVDIGDYRSARSPDEPTLLWMTRTPCQPGLSEHDQNRAGRAELLATPFEVFERNIRAQLGRMLGAADFDPAADITAITVNRWPHGYAPEHNSLWEPELPEDEQPQVVGRARFGRIAIANSDSGGGAYTDVAIDQAYRAVNELLRNRSRA